MKSELPMTPAKTVLWQCTYIHIIIPEASDCELKSQQTTATEGAQPWKSGKNAFRETKSTEKTSITQK